MLPMIKDRSVQIQVWLLDHAHVSLCSRHVTRGAVVLGQDGRRPSGRHGMDGQEHQVIVAAAP